MEIQHKISGATASETWLQLLDNIVGVGSYSRPRGHECYELLNCTTVVPMHKPIVTVAARQLGYRFMFAEAYWILTGDNRVETIAPYSKAISQFSDDGKTFAGAYGPMVLSQIDYVVDALLRDPWTRQAVMTIWRPSPPPSKDIPCTVAVQWVIRDGKLHCLDTMRSSDAWLGWPYDVFNFSMLSAYIVLCIKHQVGVDLKLGNLYLTAGSQHLYTRDMAGARECLTVKAEPKFHYPILIPNEEWEEPMDLINHLGHVARQEPHLLKSSWVHCVAEGKHNKKGDDK
jgi:thymidylate synthase